MTNSTGRLKQTPDLTWDLDLDTNDTTTHLVLPADARFRGDWLLTVTVQGPQQFRLSLRWNQDVSQGSSRECDPPSAIFSAVDADGATLHTIRNSQWPETVSFGKGIHSEITPQRLQKLGRRCPGFHPASHRRFRAKFTITGLATAIVDTTRHARVLADRVTSSFASKRPNNVRLYFPRIKAELWASATFLSAASPYLKTLLESDFIEGTRRKGKKRGGPGEGAREVGAPIENSAQDMSSTTGRVGCLETGEDSAAEDSDEETDNIIKQSSPPNLEDDTDDGDFTYREIEITETTYSTYRAVLLYLHTGYINFAPLNSTLLPLLTTSKQTRQHHLEKVLLASPQSPPPVSPKSVYRLAHLLEIPSLLALALASLRCQLTVESAAGELFTQTSALYDDVRAVVLEYVAAHWQEVRASEVWRVVNAKIKLGELPHAGAIFVELMPLVSK